MTTSRCLPPTLAVALAVAAAAALGACGRGAAPAAPTDAGPTIVAPPGGGLTVTDVWARPSPGVTSTGAVYLRVANSGAADDRLIAAFTDRAAAVELHEMRTEGGMLKMAKVEAVPVPAGGTAELAPGGTHIMLIDLAAPLTAGERFPLTLSFALTGVMTVEVEVRTDG